MYQPGLHILVDFRSNSALLSDMDGYRMCIQQLISDHSLNTLGDVFHKFEGFGFTAVSCLTESHISIHTWPEYDRATFDVFLSNYERVNDLTAMKICEALLTYFQAEVIQRTEVKR
jgi:S-adenosylmethionine decarboxylase